ncbi:MAG: hypothetical protein ACJ79K_10960 [Gemmatimonadaceae bacterium]
MTAPAITWQWGDIDARDAGGETWLTHRHADARLRVRGGRLFRDTGYAAADASVRRELARVGAIVRLRQRGRYLVHAAGVVDPSGRGWLLAGDSGSGKSTLAYALARRGWTVLGDDGVLVERSGAGLVARGWHEPLRVSRRLAGSFPEVLGTGRAMLPNDPRERVSIVTGKANVAPVAALVLLERATSFAITPVGAASALAALVRQSPWVILGDEHARAHLDLLRHAAAQRVFRLDHTSAELHTIGDVLLEAVA